jgi:DNA-directed RNA polymerase I, II, and III subunit RPABC1
MLSERGLLKYENLENNIKSLTNKISDEMTYIIKLDKYNNEDDEFYAIKFIPQKITAINKASGISEFLNKYKNKPNIVIVKSISGKAIQTVANNYPKAGIFSEDELMINLVEHDLVPQHEILSQSDAVKVLNKYNCIKRNLPRILSTDPVAKYYNMKPGDICRIIRPSKTSGFVPFYRLVIKSSNK